MRAVVLAGGTGGRMEPLTGPRPKTWLKMLGKRLVEYALEGLVEAGVRNIVVVVDGDYSEMASDLTSRYRELVDLRIVEQKAPGIEGALLSARRYVAGSGPVALAYGDIVAPPGFYTGSIAAYNASSSEALMALTPVASGLQTYGVVMVEDRRITSIHEKPTERVESTYAYGGLMVVPPAFFDMVEDQGSVASAMRTLIQKMDVDAYIWSGPWYDIDEPWDLLRAAVGMLDTLAETRISSSAKIPETVTLEGPVIVEDEAMIDHGAVIKGPAYIGRKAFVGMNAFIRPYTTLENGAIVGSHTEVKRSVLQPRAYVASFCYITDTVVGEEASVSPYVLTLNVVPLVKAPPRFEDLVLGASKRVKLGSIIGSRSKVPPRTVLQPGTVVGYGETLS